MLNLKPAKDIAKDIANTIKNSEGSILLFLSGGSAIEPEVTLLKAMDQATKDRVTLAMVDERAVPEDDENSNWGSIKREYPEIEDYYNFIIINPERDAGKAAIELSDELKTAIPNFDHVFGIYGVGENGHTAGMQPIDEDRFTERFLDPNIYASFYLGDDFPRTTTTKAVIRALHTCFVYAVGEAKKEVLSELENELDPWEMPAQLLTTAKNLVIYTDQMPSS